MRAFLKVKIYKHYFLVDVIRDNPIGCGEIISGFKLEKEGMRLNDKEIEECWDTRKPVTYKGHNYSIFYLNMINKTASLKPMSPIGRKPDELENKYDIPFDELEL